MLLTSWIHGLFASRSRRQLQKSMQRRRRQDHVRLYLTRLEDRRVLNGAGVLDVTFGGDGTVTTDFGGASDVAQDVAVQSDGKAVVVGSSSDDFTLARYNTDGSLDSTFGTGGVVTTDFSGTGSVDEARSVALDGSGNIVVAGYSNRDGSADFALARYTSAGILDSNFGTGGLVTADFSGSGSNDFASGLALDGSGNIVVAGESNRAGSADFALARFTSAGVLDTNFGTGGLVTSDFSGSGSSDIAYGLDVDGSGNIVVAGTSNSGGSNDFALARYTSAGVLDTNFGTNGRVTTDFSGGVSLDIAYGVAFDGSGNIVVAGYTSGGGNADFALARYTGTGNLDLNFNDDGLVTTDFSGSGSLDIASGLVLDGSGNIVVAGHSDRSGNNDFAVARYTSTGSLDGNFGTGGLVTSDFSGSGSNDIAYGLALDGSGKIVVAGSSSNGVSNDFAVARYEVERTNLTIDGSGNLVIADATTGGKGDTLSITFDTVTSEIVISDPNSTLTYTDGRGPQTGTTIRALLSDITGNQILASGGSGDDMLTVDSSLAAAGLTVVYDGGTQATVAGDALALTGSATSVEHVFTNASDGSVRLNGSATALVTYIGLEPVDDNLATDNRTFTFTGGAETIKLTAGPNAGENTIDSTLGESVTFTNPTTSLTINAGTGDDIVQLVSFDPAFSAAVAVNGDGGTNALVGPDATNAWAITAANAGTLTTGGRTINFAGFQNLTGGSGADTFTFADAGSVAGAVVGGNGNDTLVGDDDGNAFVVNATHAGTLAGKIGTTFSGIENLTGGSGADTFTLAARINGTFSGLGGDDTFTVDLTGGNFNSNNTVVFDGGTGTGDSLRITGNGVLSGAYSPSFTTNGSGIVEVETDGFFAFAGVEPVEISGFAGFNFTTTNPADVLTVSGATASGGQNAVTVTGNSGGIAFAAPVFFGIAGLTIDTKTHHAAGANDQITVDVAAAPSGIPELILLTGGGTNSILIERTPAGMRTNVRSDVGVANVELSPTARLLANVQGNIIVGPPPGGTATLTLHDENNAAGDSFTVSPPSSGSRSISVNSTSASIRFDSSTVTMLDIFTGSGSDAFLIAPGADGTTPININGGDPTTGTPGDNLSVDLTGVFSSNVTHAAGSGSLSSTSHAGVAWSGIESVRSFASVLAANPGDGTADTFRVVRNSGNVEISRDGVLYQTLQAQFLQDLTLSGSGDADTFDIDFGTGHPLPGFAISVDGAAGPGDKLTITGGSFETAVYDYTNATDGSVLLTTGALTSTIDYFGLEPITNTGTAADVVLNLSGLDDQAVLENGPSAGQVQLRSTAAISTFETTTFAAPTGSLTINLGGGADTLGVTTTNLASTLIVDGQPGTDAVTFSSGLTLGSGTSAGDLTVTAETINLNSASINTGGGTDAGDVALTGNVVLGADVTIDAVTSGDGFVTVTGSIDSDATPRGLTINTSGESITLGTVGVTRALSALTLTGGAAVGRSITVGAIGGAAAGVTGNVLINSDGTVATGAADTNPAAVAGAVSLNGAVVVGGDLTIDTNAGTTDGTVTAADLLKSATATFDIGATDIKFTNAANDFGMLGITSANTASIADANSLVLGNVATAVNFTLNVGSGTSTQAAGTTISGAGGLSKLGGGTLTLSAANTYTGTTTVNGGTLQLDGGAAIVDSGAVVLADVAGARLELLASEAVGALSGGGASGGNVALGGSTLTTSVASGTSTYAGMIDGSGGLTKAGGGTLTLSAANTYTGTTTVDGGTLLVNGSINGSGGTVEVNTGGLLGGSGTIATTVNVNSGGTLSPGNSPGITTVGALDFDPGAVFLVEINGTAPGTEYDQVSVNDADDPGATDVTLDGATLQLTIGYTPAASDQYVLIANDGTDAVSGTFGPLFINGVEQTGGDLSDATLDEGDVVSTDFGGSGLTARITYMGGDGNDVAVMVDGSIAVTSQGVVIIRRAMDNIQVLTGADEASAVVVDSRPIASINTNGIVVTGRIDAGDRLIIDANTLANVGTPTVRFTGTVSFDGGTGTGGDTIEIRDNTGLSPVVEYASVIHTFTGAETGSIVLDAETGGLAAFTIDYSELEPVLQSITATDVTLHYTAGAETITVTDDAAAGLSTIDSDLGESVTFANPTRSLTINAGTGDDTVTLTSIDVAFQAALTITTGDATDTDTVNLNTDLTLGSATSTGNLTVTAETIHLGDGVDPLDLRTDNGANGGAVQLTGAILLRSNVTLDTDAADTDGNVTFAGTVNSAAATNRDLTITAGGGNAAFQQAVGATDAPQSITIASAGDVTFTGTLETAGDVTQTAGSGTTAFNGATVGGALRITTDAVTLSTAGVTTVGAVNLTAQNAVTVSAGSGLDAGASTITLSANQDNAGAEGFSMADGTTIQTTNATNTAVSITVGGTGGSAALAAIRAGTTAPARVSVTAGGAITDASNAETANITAFDIILQAADGIGNGTGALNDAADLDIAATILTATNTASGAIQIAAAGNLALNAVTNTGRAVVIDAGGALTDATPALDTTINITAGTLVLEAVGGIGSDTGVVGEDADLDINADTLSATNTTGGSIQIFEVDNVDLGLVSNSGQTVVIDAGGAITDDTATGDTGGNAINILAGTAVLRAGTGIGNAATGDADIDLDVSNVAATTGTGDISLSDAADLTVVTSDNPAGTANDVQGLSITGGTGDEILVREGTGDLTVNALVTNAGTGTITLVSDGDDLLVNANVTNTNAAGGQVRLVAFGNIGFAATVTVDSNGGDIELHAGRRFAFPGSLTAAPVESNVTGTAGYQILSDGGDILTTATGNVEVSLFHAAAGTVYIIADSDGDGSGAIADNRTTGTPEEDPNLIAAAASLRAGSGIGTASNDLDLTVTTLAAATDSDGIHLANSGPLTVGTVTNTPFALFGNVGILSGVAITDPTDNNAGSDITLVAGGQFVVEQNVTNNDSGDITLDAGTSEFRLTNGAIVSATADGGNVQIRIAADAIELDTTGTPPRIVARELSGTAEVVLAPDSPAVAINLGENAAAGFTLTDAELNTIESPVVRIGVDAPGGPWAAATDSAITFTGAFDADGEFATDFLALTTTSTVTGTAGAVELTGDLAVRSGGAIDFGTAAHDFQTIAAVTGMPTPTDSVILFREGANDVTVGTVDGLTGLVTGNATAAVSAVGSIIDGQDLLTDIVAASVQLIAGTGMGGNGAIDERLEINAIRLAARADTGHIVIRDVGGGVQIHEITSAVEGAGTLRAGVVVGGGTGRIDIEAVPAGVGGTATLAIMRAVTNGATGTGATIRLSGTASTAVIDGITLATNQAHVTAAAGDIVLDANTGNFDMAARASVDARVADVLIAADAISLADTATIHAAGHVVLAPDTGTTPIGLGGMIPLPGFALTQAELNTIATPIVRIGTADIVRDGITETINNSDGNPVVDPTGTDPLRPFAAAMTGTITVVGNFTAAPTFATELLQFRTGGTVEIRGNVDLRPNDGGSFKVFAGADIIQANSADVFTSSALLIVNSAGALDTSFGGDGQVETDLGGSEAAFGTVRQPDGKILAVGEGGGDFLVVRHNPDGTLDPTFGNGGAVLTDVGSSNDRARAAALQSDGKIVVVGGSPQINTGSADFAVVRYNADGTLDASFGLNGSVVLDFGGSDSAWGVAVQPDGKILVGGFGGPTDDFLLLRFRTDGTLDTTFGNAGVVTTDFGGNDFAADLVLRPDGRIVLIGGNSEDFAIAQYLPDGSLDGSFGTGGIVTTDINGDESARSGALLADGRLVVVGPGPGQQTVLGAFHLARYNLDGSLDQTFGTGGTTITDLGFIRDNPHLALQPDGGIVVAGGNGFDFLVARYTTDGQLDPSFDSDGIVLTDFGSSDSAEDVFVDPDGRIVAVGRNGNFALVRYQATAIGTGDVLYSANRSISMDTGTSITTVNGDVTLLANNPTQTTNGTIPTGGTFTGITLRGAAITTGDATNPGGTITLDGIGGDMGDGNRGVVIQDASTITSNNSGPIAVTGLGRGEDNGAGVEILTGSQIASVNGAITIAGTSIAGGTDSEGVRLASGADVMSTGAATIRIAGTTAGISNNGVDVTGSGTEVRSTAGMISVIGQSTGAGAGNTDNIGVRLSDQAAIRSLGTASITINGTGSGEDDGDGVRLQTGAIVGSVDGAITITGTGGGVNDGEGVRLDTAGRVESVDGDIRITGTGAGTGTGNEAVEISGGAVVEAAGTAEIAIIGTDRSGTNDDNVRIDGADTAIASRSGAITIIGTNTDVRMENAENAENAGPSAVNAGQIRTARGVVTVIAADDIHLGVIQLNSDGDSTLGRAVLIADQPSGQMNVGDGIGQITDNRVGEGADNRPNILGGPVQMRAGNGIGLGDEIDTQIPNLEAVTGTGGIDIANIGTLIVGGVSPTVLGLTTGGGNIQVISSVGLTVAERVRNTDATAGQGNITLEATTGTAAFAIGGDVQAAGSGNIRVTAGAAIGMDESAADVAEFITPTGTIALTAGTDVTLGRLVTGNTTAAAVSITSTAGAVIDGGDFGGVDIDAAGGGLKIAADTNVGIAPGAATNPGIETRVGHLDVVAARGSLDITESDGIDGLHLFAAGTATLTVATGDLTDGDPAAVPDIEAVAAVITVGAGDFGTSDSPIHTKVDDLTVDTSASQTSQYIVEADGLTSLNLDAGDDAADAGNVTLTVTAGAVDDADTAPDIAADAAVVTLLGSGSVGAAAPIHTSVNSLSVSTSQGDQFLVESDGLTQLQLHARMGNIHLTVETGAVQDSTDTFEDIIAANATVVLGDPTPGSGAGFFGTGANRIHTRVGSLSVDTSKSGGDQWIAETDGLTDLVLNAGTGDIHLAVTRGAVQDSTDATEDIIATNATVLLSDPDSANRAGFFGTLANPIHTRIDSLSVDTTASGGDQVIVEMDGLTDLNLKARHAMTDLGDIHLTTRGNILDSSDTGMHPEENLTGPTNLDLLARRLVVVTNGGSIGASSNRIEVDIREVEIETGGGAIHLVNLSGNPVFIGPIDSDGGDIVLDLDADVIVQGAIDATHAVPALDGGRIEIVADGRIESLAAGTISTANRDITLDANGAGADVVLNARVSTSGAGDVTISADGSITFAMQADVSTVNGGVSITADADGGGGGAITMADNGTDVAEITSATGTIALSARGDITLGRLVTGNNTAAAVSITSTTGAVIDGGDTAGRNGQAEDIQANAVTMDADGAVVTVAQVTIAAVTGIGSGDALETQVAQIDARNAAVDPDGDGPLPVLLPAAGHVEISETDALLVERLFNNAANDAQGGDIGLKANNGQMTVNGSIDALGDIDLYASMDLVLPNTATVTGWTIDGTAGGNVRTLTTVSGDPPTATGPTFTSLSTRGVVRQVSPVIVDMQTPQVENSAEGIGVTATLTFTVGVPGETNLRVVIDWGDEKASKRFEAFLPDGEAMLVGGRQYVVRHTYDLIENPNLSGRIFVTLTVVNDPSINFFGDNIAELQLSDDAISFADSAAIADALRRVDNNPQNDLEPQDGATPENHRLPDAFSFSVGDPESLAANRVLSVASRGDVFEVATTVSGGLGLIDDESGGTLFVANAGGNQFTTEGETDPVPESSDLETVSTVAESEIEDEAVIVLRRIRPDGNVEEVEFAGDEAEKLLENLAAYAEKLPDGLYELQLFEAGEGRKNPRLINRFMIRDGQISGGDFDPSPQKFDTTEPAAPGEPTGASELDRMWEKWIAPRSRVPAHRPEADDLPHPDAAEPVILPPSRDDAGVSATETAAPVVGAVVLTTGTLLSRNAASRGSQIDRAMEAFTPARRGSDRLRRMFRK